MENVLISLLPNEQYPVMVPYIATLFIVGVAALLRVALAEEMQHYPALLSCRRYFSLLSSLLFGAPAFSQRLLARFWRPVH